MRKLSLICIPILFIDKPLFASSHSKQDGMR